jgi:hypothetical protein
MSFRNNCSSASIPAFAGELLGVLADWFRRLRRFFLFIAAVSFCDGQSRDAAPVMRSPPRINLRRVEDSLRTSALWFGTFINLPFMLVLAIPSEA